MMFLFNQITFINNLESVVVQERQAKIPQPIPIVAQSLQTKPQDKILSSEEQEAVNNCQLLDEKNVGVKGKCFYLKNSACRYFEKGAFKTSRTPATPPENIIEKDGYTTVCAPSDGIIIVYAISMDH